MTSHLACSVLLAVSLASAAHATIPAPGSTSCVLEAATLHKVNHHMLNAILQIESRSQPHVISTNTDRSVDVGIAGINSINFPDLARHGLAPADLLDPCKSTYVAAWLVSKHLHRYGNTWFGYAAYHSKTPYFNHRYQILLANELIRAGVVAGRIHPVPPLRPEAPGTLQATGR
jgi:soluble lytic murein transglycosylase-like protein